MPLWLAHPQSHNRPLRPSVSLSLIISWCIRQDSLEGQNSNGVNIYYKGDVLEWLVQLGLGSPAVTVIHWKAENLVTAQSTKLEAPALTVWHCRFLQSLGLQSMLGDRSSCVLMSIRNGGSSSNRTDVLTSKEWRWAGKRSTTVLSDLLYVGCCGRCCSLQGMPLPVRAQETPSQTHPEEEVT